MSIVLHTGDKDMSLPDSEFIQEHQGYIVYTTNANAWTPSRFWVKSYVKKEETLNLDPRDKVFKLYKEEVEEIDRLLNQRKVHRLLGEINEGYEK